MARRKWRDLVNETDAAHPGRAERRAAAVAQLRAEEERFQHTLGELRRARSLTQAEVAGALDMTQPEVSKLERRTDLYLSTLEKYVCGLGGRLELTAVFGEERFDLKLQDLVADEEPRDALDPPDLKTGPVLIDGGEQGITTYSSAGSSVDVGGNFRVTSRRSEVKTTERS